VKRFSGFVGWVQRSETREFSDWVSIQEYVNFVFASLGEAIQNDGSLEICAGLLHFVRNDINYK
jgi:hypothetical protein